MKARGRKTITIESALRTILCFVRELDATPMGEVTGREAEAVLVRLGKRLKPSRTA